MGRSFSLSFPFDHVPSLSPGGFDIPPLPPVLLRFAYQVYIFSFFFSLSSLGRILRRGFYRILMRDYIMTFPGFVTQRSIDDAMLLILLGTATRKRDLTRFVPLVLYFGHYVVIQM